MWTLEQLHTRSKIRAFIATKLCKPTMPSAKNLARSCNCYTTKRAYLLLFPRGIPKTTVEGIFEFWNNSLFWEMTGAGNEATLLGHIARCVGVKGGIFTLQPKCKEDACCLTLESGKLWWAQILQHPDVKAWKQSTFLFESPAWQRQKIFEV